MMNNRKVSVMNKNTKLILVGLGLIFSAMHNYGMKSTTSPIASIFPSDSARSLILPYFSKKRGCKGTVSIVTNRGFWVRYPDLVSRARLQPTMAATFKELFGRNFAANDPLVPVKIDLTNVNVSLQEKPFNYERYIPCYLPYSILRNKTFVSFKINEVPITLNFKTDNNEPFQEALQEKMRQFVNDVPVHSMESRKKLVKLGVIKKVKTVIIKKYDDGSEMKRDIYRHGQNGFKIQKSFLNLPFS